MAFRLSVKASMFISIRTCWGVYTCSSLYARVIHFGIRREGLYVSVSLFRILSVLDRINLPFRSHRPANTCCETPLGLVVKF